MLAVCRQPQPSPQTSSLRYAERCLGTAGASFVAAAAAGDQLHRLMMQAQGMIQPTAPAVCNDAEGQRMMMTYWGRCPLIAFVAPEIVFFSLCNTRYFPVRSHSIFDIYLYPPKRSFPSSSLGGRKRSIDSFPVHLFKPFAVMWKTAVIYRKCLK